jgi:hypothetical protein
LEACFARLFVLALLLVLGGNSAQSQDPATHGVLPLHTFQPGQWVEKVWGDFTKTGEPFVFRIHQDAGYITLPHTHPTDENITVVKGTWSLGTGRRFNRSALEHMETGTFGMVPKNMVHFAWSKIETILQVHGIGPFTSTVVEPVYELTDKGVFSLTSLLLPGRPTSSSPPDCFALRIGDRDMHDASPLVGDDHQHEHQVIRSGRDHEEVGGHHLATVVREECSPRLRRWID